MVGKGDKKELAIKDFESKAQDLAKEAKCKDNKCPKDRAVCRALLTATQSCTGDDKAGWTCTGKVRVGCFCLGPKEKGTIAPKPATAPKPSGLECKSQFGDPKDVIGISDQGGAPGETQAKTEHDKKLKEFIDTETEACAKHKCTGESMSCRLYYTTTEPKCSESTDPNYKGWSCKSQFRAVGCFCLGNDETVL